MNSGFRENFHSRRADPLLDRTADFDWKGLYASLGEAELSPEHYEPLALALRVLLNWVTKCDNYNKYTMAIIGRRAVAMAWVIAPANIEDAPSLSKIAQKCGFTKTAISIHAAEFSRVFGITNRNQTHGWNRKPHKHENHVQRNDPPAKAGQGNKGRTPQRLCHHGRRALKMQRRRARGHPVRTKDH